MTSCMGKVHKKQYGKYFVYHAKCLNVLWDNCFVRIAATFSIYSMSNNVTQKQYGKYFVYHAMFKCFMGQFLFMWRQLFQYKYHSISNSRQNVLRFEKQIYFLEFKYLYIRKTKVIN